MNLYEAFLLGVVAMAAWVLVYDFFFISPLVRRLIRRLRSCLPPQGRER